MTETGRVLFDGLAAQFEPLNDGAPRRGFGSSALTVNGKIFAALTKGELMVKLGRERVDALAEAGKGTRPSMSNGRSMTEWIIIPPTDPTDWLALARESRAFVAAQPIRPARSSRRKRQARKRPIGLV